MKSEDVTGLVSYLVSEESRFVTGEYPLQGCPFWFSLINTLLTCRPNDEHQWRDPLRLSEGTAR